MKFSIYLVGAGLTKGFFVLADAVASSEPSFYKMLMDSTGWGACVLLLCAGIINLWKENQNLRAKSEARYDEMFQKFSSTLEQHKQDRQQEKDEFINKIQELVNKVK